MISCFGNEFFLHFTLALINDFVFWQVVRLRHEGARRRLFAICVGMYYCLSVFDVFGVPGVVFLRFALA